MGGMESRIMTAVRGLGEEGFSRAMEEISSAERREIFQALGVPKAAAAASARQRTARRIRVAWERLESEGDEEAAATMARHWLARNRMEMIRGFLDRLEVEHVDGYLRDEEALRGLSEDVLASALKELTSEHDAAEVRLYAALMDLPEPAA
jgi:hypothetical protein